MRFKDLIEMTRLPRVAIHLMHEKTAENDPFYARVVQDFYHMAVSRHPKWLFAKQLEYGFALCRITDGFDAYFTRLESSARGNYRKAQRAGYVMKRFDYNACLEDIQEIRKSASQRQGALPQDLREGLIRPISNPLSRTPYHDYPHFGVFRGGKLYAYASCLVAGDLCNLHDFFGHVYYEKDGIVSLLIMGMVQEILKSYPAVNYFGYGTYFGASEGLRRFKRKFLFHPHKVSWALTGGEPRHDVPIQHEDPEALALSSTASATETIG